MADHKANQILAAIKSKLTGLLTTGQNIYQSRVYAIESLPAINLKMGADRPESIHNTQSDNELTILVEMFVKSDEPNIDSILLAIRKEIQIALMADETQGLPFVLITLPNGMSSPDVSADEQPTAFATVEYKVIYRSLLTDPSG